MQNNPQNNPSDDDSNHQRQPATQNIAGGVRTKSAIRAAISFGLLAAVCGVVAGHLVSFHRFFANLSLLFLWAFFIFVSISFTIDFKRNQGKRRVAHWGGGSIIVIGSALCLYLRAWNRHPPTDYSEEAYRAVTNLGSKVVQPGDLIEGTAFTRQRLDDIFQGYGFAVLRLGSDDRLIHDVFPNGLLEWEVDWRRVVIQPDRTTTNVTFSIPFKTLGPNLHINEKDFGTMVIICPFVTGALSRGPIYVRNRPTLHVMTLNAHQRKPIFAIGFRIEGAPPLK